MSMRRRALAISIVLLAFWPGVALAHPAAVGLTIPYTGSWVCTVSAVPGAHGYLWTVVQDNVITWQNLTYDGPRTGRTYTMTRGSVAHSRFHTGQLTVWVRAKLAGDAGAGQVTLAVQPVGGPRPAPLPTPVHM